MVDLWNDQRIWYYLCTLSLPSDTPAPCLQCITSEFRVVNVSWIKDFILQSHLLCWYINKTSFSGWCRKVFIQDFAAEEERLSVLVLLKEKIENLNLIVDNNWSILRWFFLLLQHTRCEFLPSIQFVCNYLWLVPVVVFVVFWWPVVQYIIFLWQFVNNNFSNMIYDRLLRFWKVSSLLEWLAFISIAKPVSFYCGKVNIS